MTPAEIDCSRTEKLVQDIDISHLSTYCLKAVRARVINKMIWEIELANSADNGETSDDMVFRGRNVWPAEKILWTNKEGEQPDFYERKALQRAVCEMRDRKLVDVDYDNVWSITPTNFNYIEELAKKLLVKWEWYPNCGWAYPDTWFTLQHEQRQWVAGVTFIGVGYYISASGESADIAIQNLTELLEKRSEKRQS